LRPNSSIKRDDAPTKSFDFAPLVVARTLTLSLGATHSRPECRLRPSGAKAGVWLSFQAMTDNEAGSPLPSPVNQARALLVYAGTEKTIALAKQHKVKMAIGTDILFSPSVAKLQNAEIAKLIDWFTAAEVLAMVTGTNGELLQLSGPRNPYPGKLGVVEQGALADLLLVDGNPLADIGLIADPHRKFVVSMKDGKLVKNAVL
jgi:imidazolonepropionase-like amidohydrolase